jgi:NAD(P)-dependent dehydrogenase (short-subunit alcohol dehydrogenase family)
MGTRLLADRVTIVSGVGPGLGRDLALAFAREGSRLVLGARTASRLEAVAADVAALGGSVHHAVTDVTDPAQCERLVALALDRYGRLDVLVNNAAAPDPGGRFADVDLDAWRGVVDTTLFGSLHMTAAAIPPMRAQQSGSIVFVSSMIVRRVLPGRGGYATAKAALLTAAQVLARELGPANVRVNSVVPGWLAGPSVDAVLRRRASEAGTSVDAQRDALAARMPLGALASGADCANAAVFLASDLASAVTGQALDVNAGEVCH